jgi:hypothetical protein
LLNTAAAWSRTPGTGSWQISKRGRRGSSFVQFQTRIKELTIGEVEDGRIALRVGINIGDVIVEPHDIFGDGVNIAARLEDIADPGGICISSSV